MPGRPPKTGPQTPAASKMSTSQAKVSSAAASQNTQAMAENVEVLGAIHAMQSDFSKKLDDVLEGISGLKSELQHQANRITEAEERIGKTEDDLNSMHTQRYQKATG